MGIVIGHREYHPSAPAVSIRSLSAKRAAIINQQNLHPVSDLLFKKADVLLDRTLGKVRSYNGTMYSLKKRIEAECRAGKKLPLVASLKRISNLKKIAEGKIIKQTEVRNTLAEQLFEWRETLPQLDREIARETRRC